MAKLKTVFGESEVLSVYETKLGFFAKGKGVLPRPITKEDYLRLKAELEAEAEAQKKGESEEVGEPTEEEVSETAVEEESKEE